MATKETPPSQNDKLTAVLANQARVWQGSGSLAGPFFRGMVGVFGAGKTHQLPQQ